MELRKYDSINRGELFLKYLLLEILEVDVGEYPTLPLSGKKFTASLLTSCLALLLHPNHAWWWLSLSALVLPRPGLVDNELDCFF